MNLSFLRDRVFFRDMLALAIPVAFQQFITASLSMIDVLMVGQLGETSVAALGLANQIFFLLILFLFGVTSGMAIFTAQYWGKGDVENIRRVLGICLILAVSVAVGFTLAATLIPQALMSFYTEDREVIRIGSEYLRIVGISYIMMSIAVSYISVLRSITMVKLTVLVSVIAAGFENHPGLSADLWYWNFPGTGRTRRGHWNGLWLDIRVHPAGDPGLCPENAPGGEPTHLFSFQPSFRINSAQNLPTCCDQRGAVVSGDYDL